MCRPILAGLLGCCLEFLSPICSIMEANSSPLNQRTNWPRPWQATLELKDPSVMIYQDHHYSLDEVSKFDFSAQSNFAILYIWFKLPRSRHLWWRRSDVDHLGRFPWHMLINNVDYVFKQVDAFFFSVCGACPTTYLFTHLFTYLRTSRGGT